MIKHRHKLPNVDALNDDSDETIEQNDEVERMEKAKEKYVHSLKHVFAVIIS